MAMIRRFVPAQLTVLTDEECEITIATASLALDNDIWVMRGIDLTRYNQHPIALWSHDQKAPVGNVAELNVTDEKITGRVRFAPLGISPKADEVRGLVKAGVITGVSAGIDPLESEPLDPKKPRGGQRITRATLLEVSFCSVPADTASGVTARSNGDGDMPQSTATEEKKVRQTTKRGGRVARTITPVFQRGLYTLAQGCYLLEELGYQVDYATWEAEIEGDESKVPAMLGTAMVAYGEALLAMADEEIKEALAGRDLEIEIDGGADAVLTVEERQHIANAKTPAIGSFRRGVAHAKHRAGKTLSADTVDCLRAACDAHDEAIDMHRSAIKKHKDAVGQVQDLMNRAGVSDPADDTTQTIQKSDGTAKDEGSRSAAQRRRQADILSLTAH